jgi:uncharacterized protein (UPF0276 family)
MDAAGGAQPAAFPYLGHGIGLRVPHYERALRGALEVDWVEVITENFFGGGGRPRAVLEAVRRERPLVFHGVCLGVGSMGPPDVDYLRQVKELADAFEPAWLSDHVCWTRVDGRFIHELLPLPSTRAALDVVVENTMRAQEYLGRPLVLENVSSYVAFREADMTEWEFLAELARRSGCSLLLDLNNVLVSGYNLGFSANEYLAGLPSDKVVQFHLANHTQRVAHKFDDHRGPVPPPVWELFEAALARFGAVSSLVEWDEEVPSWELLVAERDRAAARAAAGAGLGGSLDKPSGEREIEPAKRDPGRDRELTTLAPAPRSARSVVPSSLERTQRLMYRALTWPSGVRDFAEAAGDDVRRELAGTIAGDDRDDDGRDRRSRLDHIARLDIYANAYFYRLLDVLRSLFPRLVQLLGDIQFHNVVTGYLLQCPPTLPDLNRLGDRLPAFLRGRALGATLWAEVAELELALARALDAPEPRAGQRLTRTSLAALSPERWPALELALAPSTSVLRASRELERAVASWDAALGAPAPGQVPGSAASAFVIGRRHHTVHFRALEALELAALEKLSEGSRFDVLCEALSPAGAEPSRLVEYLLRWVDDEIIIDTAGAG